MKNSGIEWMGEIPNSWDVVRLKNVLKERNETNKPVKTTEILSLTNDRGVIPYAEKGDVGNKSKEDLTGYKLAYPNDIVLNSMNVIIGSVALSKYYGCVSPVYYMLNLRHSNHSIEYYNFLFQTKELQSKLKGYGNGIMEIRLRIPIDKLNSVELPIPPADIQHKIVKKLNITLDKVDKLIENEQKQIEKMKEYKQSVITSAVTKGLDPTAPIKDSEDWMEEIPVHWLTPKIKYYAWVESGGTPNRNHEEYWNGNINWVKTGELQNTELYDAEEKITQEAIDNSSAKVFPVDTILVAMYGQGKTRGMTALLKKESATNQACAGIQLIKEGFCVKYLWWCLMGAYDSLRERANGSGQPNLSGTLISDFCVTMPPFQEQLEIVDYLDKKTKNIDEYLLLKQRKIEKLQEYKKSLIYEYVTGKKEVV